ncbi:unnamed protein product [Brachionus calyciflorus]|uniref:Uncharacterized protein n=1 Tax=Brachionus calyciflorus TaxID=104777 RepID=A0A813SM81_9BILA|nr:unnamed protein product [Brachionus calyciflorus]
MSLINLTSAEIVSHICPLEDEDLAEIILNKEINGYCVINMTKEYREELFPTSSLVIKYQNLLKALYEKYPSPSRDLNQQTAKSSSINISKIVPLNQINSHLVDNVHNYSFYNCIENSSNEQNRSNGDHCAVSNQTETGTNNRENDSENDSENDENKIKKKEWKGYFDIDETLFSSNLRKKLKKTCSDFNDNDFKELAAYLLMVLNQYFDGYKNPYIEAVSILINKYKHLSPY